MYRIVSLKKKTHDIAGPEYSICCQKATISTKGNVQNFTWRKQHFLLEPDFQIIGILAPLCQKVLNCQAIKSISRIEKIGKGTMLVWEGSQGSYIWINQPILTKNSDNVGNRSYQMGMTQLRCHWSANSQEIGSCS